MRNTNYLAVLLIMLTISLLSCKDDFLRLSDPARVFNNTYYSDSASLVNAVNGVYASLQNIYGSSNYSVGGGVGIYAIADLASDDGTTNNTTTGILDPLQEDATNVTISGLWLAHYRCIARCNDVIANADNIPVTAATKTRLLAEVRYIRALAYFNLVRIWGPVPLVLTPFATPNDAYVDGRASVASVYTQIKADLRYAQANLPAKVASPASLGRATQAAAIALTGEVLLTLNDFPAATTELAKLVTNESTYGLGLQTSYSSIFLTSNEMNNEIIFAIRYRQGINANGITEGSPFNNWFAPQASDNILATGTGNFYNLVDVNLYNAFEPGDVRRDASIGIFNSPASNYHSKKYLNSGAQVVNDGNNDWIVYRYADVLLLYADALNETGQTAAAIPFVTRVRTRAGLPTTLTAATSQADMRAAILKERRVELNMEGHRWFDLLRSGNLVPVMNAYFASRNINSGKPLDPYRVLFPIPLSEIQVNANLAPNNAGY